MGIRLQCPPSRVICQNISALPRRRFLLQAIGVPVFLGKSARARAIGIAIAAVALVILVAALVAIRARSGVDVPQIAFTDLLRDLDRGAVSEVAVSGDTLDVRLSDGRTVRTV